MELVQAHAWLIVYKSLELVCGVIVSVDLGRSMWMYSTVLYRIPYFFPEFI